ncbi:uncharacterized protein K460DRAFT_192377 [Cucurbitaria berberidis CBS 394.84]|uniref:Uncharacterized protein n=1 Tax=Cucurbitaria berberidis CBS 394.84 TaxID=1168544 RepID=A0A9P4L3Z3_9PLEO|nr:uncharacterized protein K460DRAFT_192377 [Cucurbitaria berberidis CBS 394.84]KAF1840787.1 hypothetical protein K460DRAFT_192377 [Cucurbitaria berberidis CBS 394.84]
MVLGTRVVRIELLFSLFSLLASGGFSRDFIIHFLLWPWPTSTWWHIGVMNAHGSSGSNDSNDITNDIESMATVFLYNLVCILPLFGLSVTGSDIGMLGTHH